MTDEHAAEKVRRMPLPRLSGNDVRRTGKVSSTQTAWRAGGVSPPVFFDGRAIGICESDERYFFRGVRAERGDIQMPIDKIHSHKTGECFFNDLSNRRIADESASWY